MQTVYLFHISSIAYCELGIIFQLAEHSLKCIGYFIQTLLVMFHIASSNTALALTITHRRTVFSVNKQHYLAA